MHRVDLDLPNRLSGGVFHAAQTEDVAFTAG